MRALCLEVQELETIGVLREEETLADTIGQWAWVWPGVSILLVVAICCVGNVQVAVEIATFAIAMAEVHVM